MKSVLSLYLIMAFSLTISADIFQKNRALGKGMNLGNTLEAPTEGSWGEKLDTNYLKIIAEKGFQTVRIPIKWSTEQRTAIDSPYTINETFFNRIDGVINCALKNKLNVIINIHHYDTLFTNPTKEWNRFKAIWKQISTRYQSYSDSLYFELLNEPNTNLTPLKWNQLLAETVPIVRETNKTRPLIIGIAEWGGVGALQKLLLPADSNLILTVHYYNPFNFTHQGASWVEGSEKYIGTKWSGTYFEKLAVINDFDFVRSYSMQNKIPVFVGEFGSGDVADAESRHKWTSFCARLFEKYDFSWAYWAFGTTFAAYERSEKKWIDTVANAMLSTDTSILAMTKDELGTNLVKNGSLSDSSSWTFGIWDTSADASASFDTNGFTVTFTNPGTEGWNIQLLQNKINLQKGHSYVLLFDVSSDSERTISATIDQSDSGWANYGNNYSVNVSKMIKTISVPFSMSTNDTNGRVCFSFGGNPIAVHISNAQLYDLGVTNAVLHNRITARAVIPYNVKVYDKEIRINFRKNQLQPISLLISTLNGRLLYRADNVILKNRNSLTVPFQWSTSSMMILQIKGESINGNMLLYRMR